MNDDFVNRLREFPRGFNAEPLNVLPKGLERDEKEALKTDAIEILRVAYGGDLIDRVPKGIRCNLCAKAVVLFNTLNQAGMDPKFGFKFMDLMMGTAIVFCDPLGDVKIPDAI